MRDAIEPRGKRGETLELAERPIGLHKRLLNRVLDLLRIHAPAVELAMHVIAVTLDELIERRCVSRQGFLDQERIGCVHPPPHHYTCFHRCWLATERFGIRCG